MHVLLVKTSSMGDVIHTLPAISDAAVMIPGIRFDWVVEEAFAEIPAWHPAVDKVIPVALRRWRKQPLRTWREGHWARFTSDLRAHDHDLVIDAQGLLKSALITRYSDAPVHGLDKRSAREPLASRFYQRRHAVPRGQHAVERVRQLFAAALGYELPAQPVGYGLDRSRLTCHAVDPAHLVFLHGTTWATKHWPEIYWRELAQRATQQGFRVSLPWGDDAEYQRALRISAGLSGVEVLPRLDLHGLAAELAGAGGCVAVDTGLGHLAAALDVPTVSLFGPTDAGLTGAWGAGQLHLKSDFACSPCLSRRCHYRPDADERERFDLQQEQPLCFTRLAPERVWQSLLEHLRQEQDSGR